jgi:serine protease Do
MRRVAFVLFLLSFGMVSPSRSQGLPFAWYADAERLVVQVRGSDCSGTGFPINARYVVTANHVADCADEFDVVSLERPDMSPVSAVVFKRGNTRDVDLAVLQVQTPMPFKSRFTVAKKDPKLGDEVWAIGFGWDAKYPTLIRGIVSSAREDTWDLVPRVTSDMQGQYGHSGSPVLNKDGQVVGVLTNGIVAEDSGLLTLVVPGRVLREFLVGLK